MFDLTTEDPVSLHAVGKRFGVHFTSVLRWILNGRKGPTGEVVRLEGARVGSRWWTSWAAVQRFSDRLTPDLGNPSDAGPRSQTK